MIVWTIPARLTADSPIMTVYRGRGCTDKTELCQAVGLLITLLMAGSCHGVLLGQAQQLVEPERCHTQGLIVGTKRK